MSNFQPGDKVVKKGEKDLRNYGEVMDWQNTPMFQKPGYIAVYFKRQVWIKPENLCLLSERQGKEDKAKQYQQAGTLATYWTGGKA